MKKFILILIGMFLVASIFSNTIYVYPGDSIQDAVNIANNSDTVYVYNGTYTETIDIINITLTLEGENRDNCIIRAQTYGISSDNTIYANSWAENLITIQNMSIKNGYIGIHCCNCPSCNLLLDNVTITENNLGIASNHCNLDIVNCSIINNNYTGVHLNWSDVNIVNCLIDGNNFSPAHACPDGGGVYIVFWSEVFLSETTITNNYAYDNGGGIASITSHNIIISDDINPCTIEDNIAQTGYGDDLYAYGYEPGTTTTVHLTNVNPVVYPISYWIINPIMSDIAENGINTLEEMCFCFPNPANRSTKIMFNNHQNKNTEITIYNLEGQRVEAIKTENNFYNLDVSKYASGIYFYRVRNENIQPQYNKIIVVK